MIMRQMPIKANNDIHVSHTLFGHVLSCFISDDTIHC